MKSSYYPGAIVWWLTLFSVFAAKADAEPDIEKWFMSWVEGREFQSVHVEFETKIFNEGTITQAIRGIWDCRTSPTLAQYLSYSRTKAEHVGSERIATWDLATGIGKTFEQDPTSTRNTGVIHATRPPDFGRLEMPSNVSFLVFDGRCLRDYCRTAQLSVQSLNSDATIVAALVESVHANSLEALILNRLSSQPIMERHVYVRNSIGDVIPNHDSVTSIWKPILPIGYEKATLFTVATVEQSARVDGHEIPIQWRMRHYAAGNETSVLTTLSQSSLKLVDVKEPNHHYDIDYPPGTYVFDEFKNQGYMTGALGDSHYSEVITVAELYSIMESAGIQVRESPTLETKSKTSSPIPTGCAANAVFIALSMMGKQVSLEAICDDLGIGAAQPYSDFSKIVAVAQKHNVAAIPVSADSAVLRSAKELPVLLQIKVSPGKAIHNPFSKEDVHFILVDSYSDSDQTIRVFDAPHLPYTRKLETVVGVWTGKAILFGDGAIDAFLRRKSLERWALSIMGAILLLGVIIVVSRRKIWRIV